MKAKKYSKGGEIDPPKRKALEAKGDFYQSLEPEYKKVYIKHLDDAINRGVSVSDAASSAVYQVNKVKEEAKQAKQNIADFAKDRKYSKGGIMKAKKYKAGGVFPPAIKKLREKAAAKKATPKYKDSLDEVTVTAKAPKEWEKKAAEAFVNSNRPSRVSDYAVSAVENVDYPNSAGKEIKEKAYALRDDTAKRLGVKNKANIFTSGKNTRSWNKALKKAGYRK